MNRTRAWLLVSPVIAAGVLVSHALAYRITSTPADRLHGYLEHAPQVLLLLAFSGLVLGGPGGRIAAPRAHLFPLVALTTFVLQEHVERIVHDGAFPFLLTSPPFVVGLLMLLPLALVTHGLARWLLAAGGGTPARQLTVRPRFELVLAGTPAATLRSIERPAAVGRGPPSLLRSR